MRRYRKQIEVNLAIAHLLVEGRYFQVLNKIGNDWDEEATKAQYEDWKRNKWKEKLAKFFGRDDE